METPAGVAMVRAMASRRSWRQAWKANLYSSRGVADPGVADEAASVAESVLMEPDRESGGGMRSDGGWAAAGEARGESEGLRLSGLTFHSATQQRSQCASLDATSRHCRETHSSASKSCERGRVAGRQLSCRHQRRSILGRTAPLPAPFRYNTG